MRLLIIIHVWARKGIEMVYLQDTYEHSWSTSEDKIGLKTLQRLWMFDRKSPEI